MSLAPQACLSRKNRLLAKQGPKLIWALYGVFERLRDPQWTNIQKGVFRFSCLMEA
jgi:hypothetical protein